ncbi:MAG: hypothetical protein H6739_15740 [Alphaproteobacteria bacterium]|nr:hypothetical protein [Alphaproteobacteria bacterium]
MTRQQRREMRQALDARRAAARAQLERRRDAARQELERRQAARKAEEKKRRRRWLWLLLLLPLLLLRDCSCNGKALGPKDPQRFGPGAAALTPPAPAPPLPRPGRIQRRDRPEYVVDPPPPVPWLTDFRIQVVARSPRLAACFLEAPNPGTLRWSTSVDPTTGAVSEHTLEPTLLSDPLTREQRTCVLAVLSEPRYRLEAEADQATPQRVGMVIEF